MTKFCESEPSVMTTQKDLSCFARTKKAPRISCPQLEMSGTSLLTITIYVQVLASEGVAHTIVLGEGFSTSNWLLDTVAEQLLQGVGCHSYVQITFDELHPCGQCCNRLYLDLDICKDTSLFRIKVIQGEVCAISVKQKNI